MSSSSFVSARYTYLNTCNANTNTSEQNGVVFHFLLQFGQTAFLNFYTLESKDLQDSYLAGMITIQDVKQRRSRKQNVNPSTSESTTFAHQGSLFYKVRVTKDGAVVDVPVCRNAFMSFHGITRGRLRTIQASLMSGQSSPRDSRGKHQNRPRSVPEEIQLLIMDHIRSFKPRQSHYSIRNNPRKLYLPETLTIKDMHKCF
ncbi:hypothetical protein C0J52_14496 [Blattella germanica]|nr:hypothetical protein C0J52_14496 [Blattella germanica]